MFICLALTGAGRFLERDMLALDNQSIQGIAEDGTGNASVQAQVAQKMTMIVGVTAALGGLGSFWLMIDNPGWQLAALGGIYFACSSYALFARLVLYPRNLYYGGIIGLSLFFGLAMMATSAVLVSLGFPSAFVFLIFSLILSSQAARVHQGNFLAGLGIVLTGIIALLGDFSPVDQMNIQLIQVTTPAIIGILFMVYVVMLAMQTVTSSIRTRLVTILLAMVLIPLAALSIFQSQFLFNVLNDETNHVLQVAAEETALGLDDFLNTEKEAVIETAGISAFARYLELPAGQRQNSRAEDAVFLAMEALSASQTATSGDYSSFALLDMQGINQFDSWLDLPENRPSHTELFSMGLDPVVVERGDRLDESKEFYFLIPVGSGVAYISPVQIPNSTRSIFYISAPVKNAGGEIVGVLRRRYDGLVLQENLQKKIHLLGENSYPILLDENNIRLADTFTPQYLYKSVVPLSPAETKILKENRRLPDLPVRMISTNYEDFDRVLKNSDTQSTFTTEISTEYETNTLQEIGAIGRMKTMPWKLVYLQTNYSDQAMRSQQGKITTLVSSLVASVIGLLAIGAAQYLSSPLYRLTGTARRVSQGDLEAQAPAESPDEYGMLGRAFNLMTAQLRGLISSLEERVQARTQEIENQNFKLSYRASQLETVAEVARQVVSAQNLDLLLSTITHLISNRFGFYHVGIFLVDDNKEYAILRAANSPGGLRMLNRQHRLPVGKVGIVGYVTGTGQPRTATDVGSDAIFFNNPDLPQTRSEMALPLIVNNEIIGAIDIQSTEPDAFQSEDIGVFHTLADQVAIAIYNNQLYVETLQALNEAQKLHRQYLRSEWAKDASQRKVIGYNYNRNGVAPHEEQNPLWEQVFASGEAVIPAAPGGDEDPDQAVLAVPVTVRGETIGVIHVEDQGEDRDWTGDEIAVINNIANQVAIALENARLFENTVRRAEREKRVLQITAKIRSTNDPEEMMRIALNELQQALKATRTQIYIPQPDQETEEGAR